MMQWTTVFQVAATLVASGALGGGISAIVGRKKVHAETTVSLSDAAMRQVNEIQHDMDEVKTENRELKRALVGLQRWAISANRRLQQLGVEDFPVPPELWL